MLETAIVEAVQILQQRKPSASEPLIILDHEVAKRRFAVEMDCLSLIARWDLADGDLRSAVAVLEIVAELERVAGYITEIARVHLVAARVDDDLLDNMIEIQLMTEKTGQMLKRALRAYLHSDLVLARSVHASDDEVDVLFRAAYRRILAYMMGKPHRSIKQARYITQIARNVERAADRVTNICEWAVFAVTGEMPPLSGGLL
jgi:phosphate transport system protein